MKHDPQCPDPQSTFKPRAQATTLSNLIRDAWAEYQNLTFPEAERAAIADALAEHVRARTPDADLTVLRRYGFTETMDDLSVRVHDGRDWHQSFGVKLRQAIELPRDRRLLYCGGPRWSRDPNRGIKPEYRATMTAEAWANLVKSQDADERGRLPEAFEPYFSRLVEARHLYYAEYKQNSDWPEQFRSETGRWPTWRQIADKFQVVGSYLDRAWIEPPKESVAA